MNIFSRKISVLIFLCILISGIVLRFHNWSTWPREGATFDEFAWTFLGVSLWNDGTPVSWSPHKAYTIKKDYYNPQGAHFTLVTPYLEHPPLFGLIAGGFARLNGVSSFDQVTIAKIRPLALILGILSVISVYVLTLSAYGNAVGLLAAGIFAIMPSAVIGSRLVQNENFFIPFFLISLYFAYRYIIYSKRQDVIAAIILSALLPLAKVPWIAAPCAVVLLFSYHRKWKEAGLVILTTGVLFSAFLVWGLSWDREVFVNLWKLQLARYDMHFDSLFMLFRDPLIADRTFVDGWIYFGWAAMFGVLAKDLKKHTPLIFGFLSYALVYVAAIPAEPLHGWYRYPFYPFLAISTAVLIYEYWESNLLIIGMWQLLAGLSTLGSGYERILGFSYPIYRFYIITVITGILPQFFPVLKQYRIFKYIRLFSVFLVCLFTVLAIFFYTEQ